MGKILIISLSLFYLSLSLGLELNVHYCMGELDSISLHASHAGSCCCGLFEMPPGCCDDKEVDLSLDSDQQLSPKVFFPQGPDQGSATLAGFLLNIPPVSQAFAERLAARAPPPLPPVVDLRLLYHSLTFYG